MVGKTFTGPEFDSSIANTVAWCKATIGAANGHGNARSVAAIQAVVSNGGRIGDVELLSQESFTSSLVVILSGVKELAMMCSVKSQFPRLRCQGKTELCLCTLPASEDSTPWFIRN